MTQVCTRCGCELPMESFELHTGQYRRHVCRQCRNQQKESRRAAPPGGARTGVADVAPGYESLYAEMLKGLVHDYRDGFTSPRMGNLIMSEGWGAFRVTKQTCLDAVLGNDFWYYAKCLPLEPERVQNILLQRMGVTDDEAWELYEGGEDCAGAMPGIADGRAPLDDVVAGA